MKKKMRGKITPENYDLIKRLLAQKISQAKIGRTLGVHAATVSRVKLSDDLEGYLEKSREYARKKYGLKPKSPSVEPLSNGEAKQIVSLLNSILRELSEMNQMCQKISF